MIPFLDKVTKVNLYKNYYSNMQTIKENNKERNSLS